VASNVWWARAAQCLDRSPGLADSQPSMPPVLGGSHACMRGSRSQPIEDQTQYRAAACGRLIGLRRGDVQ
jgi:hypothetical protein